MKNHQFDLTRIYKVTVNAESEDEARHYVEFFLGDCPDLSQEKERREHKFSIEGIEMVYNDAVKSFE